jgi:hypothetical protein
MRKLLLASVVAASGAIGCGGGDGPPDLTGYFKTTPYANPSCNTVDQKLAGERPMDLFVNGHVGLTPVTQGLASYYARHSLSFFTTIPPQNTTTTYALDTDSTSLGTALVTAFPGVDFSNDAALMADPVLYNQILTFAANFIFKPLIDFAAAHSDQAGAVTNLVVLPHLERPGGESIGQPGTSLAGLSVSPALLAQFAMGMSDDAKIWAGVNLPPNFTPMMVLGDDVLSAARAVDPVLDDLIASHEFGHSGALVHSMVERNLMFPNVTPGYDDCTDSLDDAQLALMATTYGLGTSAATGALLATGAAPVPTSSPGALRPASFKPDRLRAMLTGDRTATRAFIEMMFHGAAIAAP